MKKAAIITLLVSFIFLAQCSSIVQGSGSCKRIAYTYYSSTENQDGDIYSVCEDGSDVLQLTDDPAFDGQPAWSPDGERIAFASARSGENQIYIMDADGEHLVQLTTDAQNDLPIWLPDGGQIAFRITDGLGLWWWRIIDLDKNEISQLTEPDYDFFFQKQAWSPDGNEIAYMSMVEQENRNDGASQIHVKNLDGSADRPVTGNLWANINPVWSPDGGRLAFLSEMHGEYNVFALYVMRSDGNGLKQVSEPVYTENAIYTWSPDGGQIAIGDLFDGRIRVIDLASGTSRDLISLGEGDSIIYPAWQP